jgi:hypothetical protein
MSGGQSRADSSALGMGLHALTLLIQQRLIMEIRAFRDRARLVVLPQLALFPGFASPSDERMGRDARRSPLAEGERGRRARRIASGRDALN